MAAPASATDELSPEQEPRLSYVLARLERAARSAIEERVRPLGLTRPEYTALSVLQTRSGLSNAQLARRCYVTPQSMSEVILALESRGLIRRAPDRLNRRILRTVLTSKGNEVLAACDAAVNELENTMLHGVAPAAQRQLVQAMVMCVHNLGAGF